MHQQGTKCLVPVRPVLLLMVAVRTVPGGAMTTMQVAVGVVLSIGR